jgi:hypothetical protein
LAADRCGPQYHVASDRIEVIGEGAVRKDVPVQNDSGGLSLISSAVMDRVIDDNRENDQAFAEAHEVVLLTLPGDETFVGLILGRSDRGGTKAARRTGRATSGRSRSHPRHRPKRTPATRKSGRTSRPR